MHNTHEHRRRGRRMRSQGRGGHRAKRGDVRSAILTLLGEKPMHCYEMIQHLEDRTGGRWRPSAGSIYPTSGSHWPPSSWRTRGWSGPTTSRASASSI